MKRLAILFLLLPIAVSANPFKALGDQIKRTFYTDVKRHPLAWGLNLGLQFGLAYADTASSCIGWSQGRPETGLLAQPVLGRHPHCGAGVAFTTGTLFVFGVSENWLANDFQRSCNEDTKWDSIPAHTHNRADCFKWVPTAFTVGLGAKEIPTIRNNVDWLEAK